MLKSNSTPVQPNITMRPVRRPVQRDNPDPFIYLEAPNEPVAEMDHLFHPTEEAQFWERLAFAGVTCCCEKLLQNEIMLRQHQSRLHADDEVSRGRYKCIDCNRYFNSPLQLSEHLEVREGKDFYRCKICNVLTKQWKHLQLHFEFTRFHPILDVSEEERLKFEEAVETVTSSDGRCCGCDLAFSSGEELFRHTSESHQSEEHMQFACTICHQSHSDWNSLHKHQQLFIGERTYRCRVADCGFQSESRQTLKKHVDVGVHGSLTDLPQPIKQVEPIRFHCCFSLCSKTFEERDELDRHSREEHAERRAFNSIHSKDSTQNVCSLCARVFPTDKLYASHLESLTAPKAMCSTCGKTVSRYGITKHMRLHTEAKSKSFTCQECGKVYATKVGLLKHEKRDHLNEFPEACQFCEKRFILKSDLKHHMAMRHTQHRPYKCSQCELAFVTRQQLARHTATHTDERPYDCSYCSNTYRHDADRKRHEQGVHLNEKHFKCGLCDAAFVRERELRLHTGSVHKC